MGREFLYELRALARDAVGCYTGKRRSRRPDAFALRVKSLLQAGDSKRTRTRCSWQPLGEFLLPRPDSSVVERGPEKAGVGGSIPSLATTSPSGHVLRLPLTSINYLFCSSSAPWMSVDFR